MTHDRPDAPGWSSAATALHSIRDFPGSLLLVLEASGSAPIVIDFRHNAFAWDVSLDQFPSEPESVAVQTQAVRPSDPPVFPLPGRNLDALLWLIGLNSFAGAPAWWLLTGDRYRLARWPNLTELAHTPEQMRLIAMLGNGAFTADELVTATGADPADTQRLLNALSLMGILREVIEPAVAAPPVASTRGLFRRLVERFSSHA